MGRRALLIGNSTFPADAANLPPLQGPPFDVFRVALALTDSICGLHQAEDIHILLDADQRTILTELQHLFDAATWADELIVYYAGHGFVDLNRHFWLAARDTVRRLPRATAIDEEHLRDMATGSAAGSVTYILDCCHSGSFAARGAPPTHAEEIKGDGRVVIASTRADQLAADRDMGSEFTELLATALTTADADRDGDGFISAHDAYEWVRRKLRAQAPAFSIRDSTKAPKLARARPQQHSELGNRISSLGRELVGAMNSAELRRVFYRAEQLLQEHPNDPELRELQHRIARSLARTEEMEAAQAADLSDRRSRASSPRSRSRLGILFAAATSVFAVGSLLWTNIGSYITADSTDAAVVIVAAGEDAKIITYADDTAASDTQPVAFASNGDCAPARDACDAGQRCTLGADGRWRCLTEGTIETWYPCTSQYDCKHGSACVDNNLDEKYYCKPFCRNDADCRPYNIETPSCTKNLFDSSLNRVDATFCAASHPARLKPFAPAVATLPPKKWLQTFGVSSWNEVLPSAHECAAVPDPLKNIPTGSGGPRGTTVLDAKILGPRAGLATVQYKYRVASRPESRYTPGNCWCSSPYAVTIRTRIYQVDPGGKQSPIEEWINEAKGQFAGDNSCVGIATISETKVVSLPSIPDGAHYRARVSIESCERDGPSARCVFVRESNLSVTP